MITTVTEIICPPKELSSTPKTPSSMKLSSPHSSFGKSLDSSEPCSSRSAGSSCYGSDSFSRWNPKWGSEFMACKSFPRSAKEIVSTAINDTKHDCQLQDELSSSFLCFVTRGTSTEMEFEGVIDDSFDFGSDCNNKWTLLKMGGNGQIVHYVPRMANE